MDQDLISAATTSVIAVLAKEVLGPSFKTLADELNGITQYSAECVKRIFENAKKKRSTPIDSSDAVPLRVAARVIQEGRFCEGDIFVEYFGGVLASARTRISRDDRAAANVALISRLTAYQLRSHYIVYRTIKCLFIGSNIAVSSPEGRHSLEVLIPFSVYSAAMDFSGEEDNRTLLHHAMSGLAQEDLIEKQGTWNGGLVAYSIQPESEDISVTPSVRGVELFLAAYGFGHFGIDCFLSSECVINDFVGISIPEGGRKGRPNHD